MSSISDEDIEDQWTTYWTGPYHPNALAYSARTGVSYDYGGSQTIILGGMAIIRGGGGTDMAALRRANRDSDQEDRDHAATDMELDTGHTFHVSGPWKRATRGERLRSGLVHKLIYEAYSEEVKKRLATLGPNEEDEIERSGYERDIPLLEEMLVLVEQLNQLVLDETKGDWEWEEGFEAQGAIRSRQTDILEGLSKTFADLGLDEAPFRIQAGGLY